MFTAWGDRKVSEYWGNGLRCGKSGFTVNRGAVNRGFTVLQFQVPTVYSCGDNTIPSTNNLMNEPI